MYGSIILISIIIGLIFIYKELQKNKIPNNIIFLYIFMMVVYIVFGGKLFTIYTSKEDISFILAGLSSYGGAIGALVALVSFIKMYKEKSSCFINITILSLPLFYSLSKIACFVAGCCYGIEYNGLFHIYSKEAGFNTFPIQMVETIVFLIIFIYFYRKKNNKYVAYKVLLVSATSKFLLDYLRYSHNDQIISINQITSLIIIVLTIIVFMYKRNKEG